MICQQCGVEAPDSSGFCPKCGARLGEQAAEDVTPGVARMKELAASRQGGETPEEDLWTGSFSPKAMIGTWILMAIITVAAIVLGVLFLPAAPLAWPVLIGGVLLMWLGGAAYLGYRRMSVHYRLTNHRFFHERGILKRSTDRIEVIDMDDITCEQGIVERMLGVGTVRITSSDRSHPELKLPGIDDVKQIAERMDNLRRAERMRRGLHIESI